jgi:hypothetical protein
MQAMGLVETKRLVGLLAANDVEGNGGETLGQRGKSKDHRPDLKQMVVGGGLRPTHFAPMPKNPRRQRLCVSVTPVSVVLLAQEAASNAVAKQVLLAGVFLGLVAVLAIVAVVLVMLTSRWRR